MRKDLTTFQIETIKAFGKLREESATEFGKMRAESATEFGKVRTEIERSARRIIMWNIGAMLTMTGITATVVFALLRYLGSNPPI